MRAPTECDEARKYSGQSLVVVVPRGQPSPGMRTEVCARDNVGIRRVGVIQFESIERQHADQCGKQALLRHRVCAELQDAGWIERRSVRIRAARRYGGEKLLDVVVSALELRVVHAQDRREAPATVVGAGATVEINESVSS